MATYTILTNELEAITKKINRIAKKCTAAKHPFEFSVGETYTRQFKVKNDGHSLADIFTVSLTDITVDCQFKFSGWTALGRVQRKDGIVQCYFKDPSLIKEYKDTDFHCDHCHKPVFRNSVIILEDQNGQRKTVGTSCVKEFTCGLDGNLIAAYANLSNLLEVECFPFDGTAQDIFDPDKEWFKEKSQHFVESYDIKEIVSCAAYLIRTEGFHSSQEDEATWKYINEFNFKYVSENDNKTAEDAINWIINLSEDELINSYLFNLSSICKAGFCTQRHFGLLASLIVSYEKYLRTLRNNESTKESNYFGNIGDKISIEVELVKTICYESVYGSGYFHLFSDSEGNIFKWSTNKSLNLSDGSRIQDGSKLLLKGTIKDHEEYRNQKQTTITRCKYSLI